MSGVLFGSFGAHLLDEAQMAPLGAHPDELIGIAAILAALTIAFALAIAGIMSLASRTERAAEPFAAATFSALFGFYVALALSGSPAVALFSDGPLITLFIALGFAALLFDHVIADREDEEGDATFEAVMAHLEEAKRAAIAKREGREGSEAEKDRR
ncbi:hypothetical protein [Jiella mangrovi]|uniref:Uncharacterized protein n=1 Tax=Jiella mangrovi TaxID=2821407 RepID=A0ABS4BFC1_9HYPH|nr:hypothetical protein [Jiella mangrovi]MBP0615406.1 hypothetical protein [Jiella mangrovi]